MNVESFIIKGFRGFRELSLHRLGNVNLVVGKNNVGKTSLLEAIYLYGSRSKGRVLAEVLYRRGDITRRFPMDESGAGLTQEQLTRILSIHHDGSPRTLSTTLGPTGGPTFSMEFVWMETELDGEKGATWVAAEPEDEANWGEKGRPAWILRAGADTDKPLFLDELHMYNRYVRNYRLSGPVMLDSAGMRSDMVLGFEELKKQRGFESLILQGLRIILPDIQEIFTAGDRRTVWVRTTRQFDAVPLQRLGEGMTRVFALTVAMVQARKGFLLVDEVENGLHYSVIPKVWAFLMQLAESFSVQVFATTHSWDCIQGYQWAVQQNSSIEAYLIRLDYTKGNVKATTFDRSELSTVVREEIEVR